MTRSGRDAALLEGAQQAEAAGEHHVAVRRRELERQRAAGKQLAAWSGGVERQAGGRGSGQHGAVAAVFAHLGAGQPAGQEAPQALVQAGRVESLV